MASPDDVYFAELGSVRKQIYITTEHDRKLKRLAQRWNCTEAAIVRRALDDVRDDDLSPEDAFFEQLRAQGSIVDYSHGGPRDSSAARDVGRCPSRLHRIG